MQAQEQALQTTSASLLEEFEDKSNPAIEETQTTSDNNPTIEESQTTSDGAQIPTVSPNNPLQPLTLPQNNSLSIIPNAMDVLLDMNNTEISQEVMVYESGVESEASPNSSLSFAQPMPHYATPPNLGVGRSFSLPPRNYSQMWHGAGPGRYRHCSFSDCVSET